VAFKVQNRAVLQDVGSVMFTYSCGPNFDNNIKQQTTTDTSGMHREIIDSIASSQADNISLQPRAERQVHRRYHSDRVSILRIVAIVPLMTTGV
jgi:hypothetical protein